MVGFLTNFTTGADRRSLTRCIISISCIPDRVRSALRRKSARVFFLEWLVAGSLLCAGGCSKNVLPIVPTTPAGNDVLPRISDTVSLLAYQHIASSSGDPRPTGIYVSTIDSLTTRLVVTGYFQGFDWLPGTDTLIVAASGRIIAVAASDGSFSSLVTHEAFNPSVSPDGRYVAFDAAAGSRSHLFFLDRYSGLISDPTPDSMLYEFPSWSPVGSELVVVGATPTKSGLFTIAADGRPLRQLTQTGGVDRSPAWSPTGEAIAWEIVSGSTTTLWSTDTVGATHSALIRSYQGICWSADGKSLAYSSSTAVGARIFLLNLTTHQSRQLTH